MAAMEAPGILLGALLKTTPMTMVKLQLCAHNADVEEVIEINDDNNIGNKIIILIKLLEIINLLRNFHSKENAKLKANVGVSAEADWRQRKTVCTLGIGGSNTLAQRTVMQMSATHQKSATHVVTGVTTVC